MTPMSYTLNDSMGDNPTRCSNDVIRIGSEQQISEKVAKFTFPFRELPFLNYSVISLGGYYTIAFDNETCKATKRSS